MRTVGPFAATLLIALPLAITTSTALATPLVVELPSRRANQPPPASPIQRTLTSWTTGYREASRLRSPIPQARKEAAEVLGRFGDPSRARANLIEALTGESNPTVRRAIVQSLTRRAHPESAEVIIDAFRGGMETEAVAIALAEIGTADCVRALIDAMSDASLGEYAEDAIVRIGARAVPNLLASLREGITLRGIRALGRIGRRDATLPLLELAGHESLPIRLEVLRALGAIGDPRAAPVVRAQLEGGLTVDPAIASVALATIAQVGSPEDGDVVEPFLADEAARVQGQALHAMLAIDPPRGARAIEAAVTSSDEARVRVAAEVALEWPIAELVAVLYGLLTEGTRTEEAASALTAVVDGGGVPVLLREAQKEDANPVIVSELAAALRRHDRTLSRRTRNAALQVLAREEGHRGVLLRALARGSVRRDITRLLSSEDAEDRATGAHALLLRSDASGTDRLRVLAARETDAEAFRRIAHAALAFGVDAPFPEIFQKLNDPEMRSDALVWAAASLDDQSARTRRRIGEAARRDLRGGSREAAMAAWAIAEARDRTGYRALLAALHRDTGDLRLAAARALGALRVSAASEILRAEARVETDPGVRRALLDAADSPDRRPRGFAARGRFTLRVAVSTHSEVSRVPLDVVLPDGRWLRIMSAPGGELILPDLPDGTADVRVRL